MKTLYLRLIPAVLILSSGVAYAECATSQLTKAKTLAQQSQATADPLKSSLILMQALQLCKQYQWWMRLGDLQSSQGYWFEAADAYIYARDFFAVDPDGEPSLNSINYQAEANVMLAQAYWESDRQPEALSALEEARAGFEYTGTPLPTRLLDLQARIDDRLTLADARTLTQSISFQRSRSSRGVGVRSRKYADESAVEPNGSQTSLAKINLQVLFDSDSDEVASQGLDRLSQMAQAIEQLNLESTSRLLVVGHTDSQGPSDYNLDLSERRAKTVLEYLMRTSNTDASLEAIGKGESELRYPANSSENHRRNRRVELVIVD